MAIQRFIHFVLCYYCWHLSLCGFRWHLCGGGLGMSDECWRGACLQHSASAATALCRMHISWQHHVSLLSFFFLVDSFSYKIFCHCFLTGQLVWLFLSLLVWLCLSSASVTLSVALYTVKKIFFPLPFLEPIFTRLILYVSANHFIRLCFDTLCWAVQHVKNCPRNHLLCAEWALPHSPQLSSYCMKVRFGTTPWNLRGLTDADSMPFSAKIGYIVVPSESMLQVKKHWN